MRYYGIATVDPEWILVVLEICISWKLNQWIVVTPSQLKPIAVAPVKLSVAPHADWDGPWTQKTVTL